MISSASRSADLMISERDFDRSLSILEKTERNMPRTFSGVGRSSHADILAKVMSDVGMEKEVKLSVLIER